MWCVVGLSCWGYKGLRWRLLNYFAIHNTILGLKREQALAAGIRKIVVNINWKAAVNVQDQLYSCCISGVLMETHKGLAFSCQLVSVLSEDGPEKLLRSCQTDWNSHAFVLSLHVVLSSWQMTPSYSYKFLQLQGTRFCFNPAWQGCGRLWKMPRESWSPSTGPLFYGNFLGRYLPHLLNCILSLLLCLLFSPFLISLFFSLNSK